MAGGYSGKGKEREGAGVEGRSLPPRLAAQAPALAAEMRAPPPRAGGGSAGAGPSGAAQQPAFAPQMNHLAAAQSIFNFQVGAHFNEGSRSVRVRVRVKRRPGMGSHSRPPLSAAGIQECWQQDRCLRLLPFWHAHAPERHLQCMQEHAHKAYVYAVLTNLRGGAQNLQQAHTSAALAAMMQGSGGPDGHNPFEALLGQPFLGGGGAPPMPDLTTLAASVEGARLLPHPPNAPAVP